jgi:transposase InsO family protein
MDDLNLPRWQRWAQFRFAVIGGLLSSPPQPGDLQQAIEALAQNRYQHPFAPHKVISLGFSTIERWYYRAKDAPDPIAALGRKPRTDKGKRTAISEQLLEAVKEQYQNYPGWSVQLHYDNLAALAKEHPQLQPLPSYKTVLRCMQEHGWHRRPQPSRPTEGQIRAAERLERREVRSYEASHVHALWHLDFHTAKLRLLDSAGQWHHPLALGILDDYSRLCCHLQFYLAETAQCLVHGLTQALMKRGMPRALMTDNGAAMLAEETRQGLARLGISHETTLAYSPYQNGKQEAFWAQLEGRFLAMFKKMSDLTLAFLNHAAQAWVEQDYHRNPHRETHSPPIQRMLAGIDVSRHAPDTESLKLAFTRQITRTPRRSDATVLVDGIRYELPVHYAHTRTVSLRAPSWDKSTMTLVDPHTGSPLARLLPQDKAKNASGHRRLIQPTQPIAAPTTNKTHPMPALLRTWLAEYAATGLPPAYLPMEEVLYD